MNKVCPKCRYVRKAEEAAPDWQCPNCSIAYEKIGIASRRVTNTKTDDASGAKWWHVLISASVSPIFAGALWVNNFTSHPILTGLVLFGVVWAMLHHYKGGGDADGSYTASGNDDGGSDGGDSAASD